MLIEGLKNRILREGILFNRYLEFLEKSQYYSKEEIRNYQDERLSILIKYSYENVPYYKNIFDNLKLKPSDVKSQGDLWKIPLLTKDDVKKNFSQLKSTKTPKLILNIGHTSGTTGTPAHFYRDLFSINFENAIVRRQWQWAGVHMNDKIAICRGIKVVPDTRTVPPFWAENPIQRQLFLSSFHLSDENLRHYIDELLKYKPVALQAYPSTAYIIAKYLIKTGVRVKLKAVFTSSEPLYGFQREAIEDRFECKTWDFYGMAERVVSASECEEHNSLHLNEEYGITEFIKGDELSINEGILVGTTLHNFAMPLLRYVTNDYVKLRECECNCGRKHRLIYPVETKQEDMIVTSDGRWVSPSIITHAFKPLTHVSKSQVIQHEINKYEIKIVPEDGFSDSEIKILMEGLKERFGSNSIIDINIVDDIPRTNSGKYRWVISHVNGGKSHQ